MLDRLATGVAGPAVGGVRNKCTERPGGSSGGGGGAPLTCGALRPPSSSVAASACTWDSHAAVRATQRAAGRAAAVCMSAAGHSRLGVLGIHHALDLRKLAGLLGFAHAALSAAGFWGGGKTGLEAAGGLSVTMDVQCRGFPVPLATRAPYTSAPGPSKALAAWRRLQTCMHRCSMYHSPSVHPELMPSHALYAR